MGWIEVDHVVGAVTRDGPEQVFNQGAVRIDYSQALTGVHVGDNHVAHERGLPTPDLPKIAMCFRRTEPGIETRELSACFVPRKTSIGRHYKAVKNMLLTVLCIYN